MLTPEQQERYSRHLLLDGFDQDRIRSASFHVRGGGAAALWAARYLAASGAGGLRVDEPDWHDELRRLGPWTDLSASGTIEIDLVAPSADAGGAAEAIRGTQAALDAVREALAT